MRRLLITERPFTVTFIMINFLPRIPRAPAAARGTSPVTTPAKVTAPTAAPPAGPPRPADRAPVVASRAKPPDRSREERRVTILVEYSEYLI